MGGGNSHEVNEEKEVIKRKDKTIEKLESDKKELQKEGKAAKEREERQKGEIQKLKEKDKAAKEELEKLNNVLQKLSEENKAAEKRVEEERKLRIREEVARKEQERKEEEEKKKLEEAEKSFSAKKKEIITSAITDKITLLQWRVERIYREAGKKIKKDDLRKEVLEFLKNVDFGDVYESIISKEITKIKLDPIGPIKRVNAIVVGKSGVGKSTLVNVLLHLEGDSENAAKTGNGISVTQGKPKAYTSDKYTIYDTRGLEAGSFSADDILRDIGELVVKLSLENDPDTCIHVILYCINTGTNRIEEEEREALKKLMEVYDGGKLPVIIVLTQSYFDEDVEPMEKSIREIVGERHEIIPVIAKEKGSKKAHGIEGIYKVMDKCAENTSTAAFRHSIKVQMEEAIAEHYKSPAFIESIKNEGIKSIYETEGVVKQIEGMDNKLPFIEGVFNRVISLWVGEKGKPDYRDNLRGIMSIIITWANEVFKIIKSEVPFDGYGLFEKISKAKEEAEKEHSSKSISLSLSECVAGAEKTIVTDLLRMAEDYAFNEVSKYSLEIFVDAFSDAFMDKIKGELSSKSSLELIDIEINKARHMYKENEIKIDAN